VDALIESLEYLPYAPLIWVAWADGELEPAELQHIQALATGELRPGIDDLPVLAGWLDPACPPSPAQLLALLRRIRQVGLRVPPGERLGLAELGLALARKSGGVPLPSVIRAVQALEDALGVLGAESVQALVGDSGWLDQPPTGLDQGVFTRFLDGRDHETRNRVRDLLASGRFVRPVEPTRAEYRELVLGWVQELADLGYGELAYPEITGAAEDLGAFLAFCETLADFDLNLVVKVGVQFGLFGGAILFLGTDRHHEMLPDIAAAKLLGCFAMTETGHGSNVQALGTTATWRDGGWEIVTPNRASWKDYIGNAAAHARLAVVFAQLVIGEDRYGVHAFLVPIRDSQGNVLPGVLVQDCGPKLGLNGIDNGRLCFDAVRVPAEALLDRYAQVVDGVYHTEIPSPTRRFFTQLSTLVGGRVAIGSAAVAAARSALAIAIRYAETRRQFGPSSGTEVVLLDHRSHQKRLLPRLARAVCLTLANRDLSVRYTQPHTRELEARAAALKVLGTRFCTDTIQACREACGGAGYLAENRFAALKADSDVFTTFEGDNTVLLQLAARGVLTAFRRELGETRFGGVFRYLAERAEAELRELDPVSSRRTDSRHLRSAPAQQELLHHRLDTLTWSAAGRLRSRMSQGMTGFDAVLECQDHLLALGRAYGEVCVFDAAWAAIKETQGTLRTVLDRLLALHGLALLDQDQAWFLRHGLFEPGRARAVRRELAAVCLELRPDAVSIVAGFALPPEVLGAPIAQTQ
jgi:acyl-CoA oxidase